MKRIKNFFSKLPPFVIWLLISFFFWSWIFNLVGDTSTFKKVSVYIDCNTCADLDLTVKLEDDLPEGIRMMKVHPLSYVAFDEATMLMGDILILRESRIEGLLPALHPVTGLVLAGEADTYYYDGTPYGFRVYNAESGEGILSEYVTFLTPEEQQEDFYLFFLYQSNHLGPLRESRDDAAIEVAARLLGMK